MANIAINTMNCRKTMITIPWKKFLPFCGSATVHAAYWHLQCSKVFVVSRDKMSLAIVTVELTRTHESLTAVIAFIATRPSSNNNSITTSNLMAVFQTNPVLLIFFFYFFGTTPLITVQAFIGRMPFLLPANGVKALNPAVQLLLPKTLGSLTESHQIFTRCAEMIVD